MQSLRHYVARRFLYQRLHLKLTLVHVLIAWHCGAYEPATVVLPDMVGLTGAEAARLLRLLGLVADCDARRCDDTVIATVPPAGSELRRGAVVLLQF